MLIHHNNETKELKTVACGIGMGNTHHITAVIYRFNDGFYIYGTN